MLQKIHEGGAAVCNFCCFKGWKALTADRRTRPRCGGHRRRCAPREDGLALKGGNVVLTPFTVCYDFEGDCVFQCPEGR